MGYTEYEHANDIWIEYEDDGDTWTEFMLVSEQLQIMSPTPYWCNGWQFVLGVDFLDYEQLPIHIQEILDGGLL